MSTFETSAIIYILIMLENRFELTWGVESKQQKEGMIPAGEAIGMLDLVKNSTMHTKNISSGEVIIYI